MPGSNDENIIDTETLEIEAGEAEAQELARRLEELNKKNFEKKTIRQAKSNLEKRRTHVNDRLTHKERKPNSIINPTVRELICLNVLEKGMRRKEASEMFKVSIRQVHHIICEDPNHKKYDELEKLKP